MMVNGIMVEISSNVGHKEYICMCVPRAYVCVLRVCVDSGNFVVIILGYTANAGACRVPTVCHCIDDELTWEGEERGKERHGYGPLFLAATA